MSFGVLHGFQEFYVQITELKRQASGPKALPPGSEELAVSGEAGLSGDIWRKAAAILDQHCEEALYLSGVAVTLNREARFVMAAFADEIFVYLDWPGRAYWLTHLLETRYFQTQSSGDTFFVRVAAVLKDNEPAGDELRILYLTCLALGFRGKYVLGPDGDRALRGYRTQLYEQICHRTPSLLDKPGHLFPEAYQSTISGGAPSLLPSPFRWRIIALGTVVCWLGISWLVWEAVSGDLRRAIAKDDKGIKGNATGQAKQTPTPSARGRAN